MKSEFPSKFLSSERSDKVEIQNSFKIFQKLPFLQVVIDAISSIAMIIDKNRQIIFVNKKLIDVIGVSNLDEILGLRPGELLSCKHSINKFGGCGTAEACKYCGAAISIKQSIEQAIVSENECRISIEKKGKATNLDLLVTATPIKLENELYFILSIADISNEKRRKVLERVFFHDVVNTAGGLKGLLGFLNEDPSSKDSLDLISMASQSANQLLEEILMQRTLVAAENGELPVNKAKTNPLDIISEVRDLMSKHDVARGIAIDIKADNKCSLFITDPVILRRVLTNLLKNALEASTIEESVSIGFNCNDEQINFFVHNNSVLSEKVKMQIFQRSFSTKGDNRGIGTYSIKLLTENYLGGKVSFSSDKINGTIFNVSILISPEN